MESEGPRVVLGVTGSLANLAALHAAVWHARNWQRPLLAVFARPASENPPRPRRRARHPASPEAATTVMDQAFTDGFGVLPTDIELEFRVGRGAPAELLLETAERPGDLLIIGASRGGLRRLWHPTVSAECRSRARQLIVVPRPPLLDELGQLRHIRDIRGLASL